MAEEVLEEIDAPVEDVYTDESSYYLDQEKADLPVPDRNTFIEKIIDQYDGLVIIVWTEFEVIFFKTLRVSPQIILFWKLLFGYFLNIFLVT